jgi:hypothetical protein
MDDVPSNTPVASPLKGVRILQTDPVRSLDEADMWTRLVHAAASAMMNRATRVEVP